jgi:hypothetical protein
MADDQWRPRCPPARNLVRPVRLDPTGVEGPTRHQARRGLWRQTTYGFHVPSSTDSGVVEQRILEQSMRVGADGAVTGWAALRLYGAAFFDGFGRDARTPLPVPLVTPRKLSDTAESVASRVSLAGHRIWSVQGVRCVGVERAVVDEILRCNELREAVVVIDMACAARITSLQRIASYVERHPRAGNKRALDALALADEGSLSPQETRMRLVWVIDAGWPPPLCNPTVYRTDGDVVGRPDLLDPATGVAGEYDGALHRDRTRHRTDVARADRFRQSGLEPFIIVAGDTVGQQVERMEAARSRALAQPAHERRWTLEPPPWAPLPPYVSLDDELDDRGWVAD